MAKSKTQLNMMVRPAAGDRCGASPASSERNGTTPAALDTLRRQNKPNGFMCVSCSWAKPADYHAFEFCENGAKATLWELTTRRCTPDFFAKHTVSELRDLERLRSGAAGPPDPSHAL